MRRAALSARSLIASGRRRLVVQSLLFFSAPRLPSQEGFGARNTPPLALAADDEAGPPDFMGPDSASVAVIFNPASLAIPSVPSAQLPRYVGEGSVQALFVSTPIEAVPIFGVGFPTLVTEGGTANLTVTLAYEFVPVPEPSAFVLAGLGLLAGAALQRYRRQHA